MSSEIRTPAIIARNLTRKFGDFTAVDNVSFEVAHGEIFGFLGPNGSGKSTTIKMLTGLMMPSSGEGVVAGIDVSQNPDGVRRHIGYMSQKFSLYQNLTVKENLRFYSDVYEIPIDEMNVRISETINRLDLAEYKNKLARDLPAGVRQRLALGVSYIHKPDILFLDEPTAGVDPSQRRVFWDWIYDLSASGVAVFVTTHYMDEVEHCERIGLINDGVIIALGSTRDLKIETAGGLPVAVESTDTANEIKLPDDIISRFNLKPVSNKYETTLESEDKLRELKSILKDRGLAFKLTLDLPCMEDVFTSIMRSGDAQ